MNIHGVLRTQKARGFSTATADLLRILVVARIRSPLVNDGVRPPADTAFEKVGGYILLAVLMCEIHTPSNTEVTFVKERG